MSAHKRPEPLLTKAKVTAAISGLASLLVTAVAAVAATVPVLIHAVVARKDVTPVSDPRDDAGRRLVAKSADDQTADVLNVAQDAADALAAAEDIHPTETAA